MSQIRKHLSDLKTFVYRKPLEGLSKLKRWGPDAYFNINKWRQEMEQAAYKLPIIPPDDNAQKLEVWFLTGKNFWYQTAFCLYSLSQHSNLAISPVILDDGTLGDKERKQLSTLFPSIRFIDLETSNAKFNQNFPLQHFPNIHFWRTKQLLFRKLTDVHANSQATRLFFDSDMLFFQRPLQLEQWVQKKDEVNIVQKDCWESYGYSRELTKQLCGKDLPERANIGVFSLNGGCVDWEQVEHWVGVMKAQEGPKYNITQCTTAMLMTQSKLEFLDAHQYQVFPEFTQQSSDLVMGHYVSDSKPFYFSKAWKMI